MAQPLVTDYRAIIDAVRRSGSVHYRKDAVPEDFIAWWRRLRQVARAADLRISVTRSREFVIVENVNFESSEDDSRATAEVIGAVFQGRHLSFGEALHAVRRHRMRIVSSPGQKADE